MKKIKNLLFILPFSYISCGLGQVLQNQNEKINFNSSYWNAYADKLQLNEKDKEEFIGTHRFLNSQHSNALNGGAQNGFNQRPPNPGPNAVLAGACVNTDFEAGNIGGWVPTCGFNPLFNPLGCCPNPGGQQLITSGPGLDPFGGFPIVCPGGNYSLRLGSSLTGGKADRIEQTFLVSAANANFTYKYAVVFQDPGHAPAQQPYFQVDMLNANNVQIPCGHYYVASGQNIPGFLNSPTPGVIYKPWTTVAIDLTPFIGQNVTIRFTTYDCSLGGHFGYAYIDGVCQAFVGNGSSTLCTGGSTTFCAPTGFATYTWNGPGVNNLLGQCVNVNAAGVYSVHTTLWTGCPGPAFAYTLTYQSPPIANAGPQASVCANNNHIGLNGSITGYSASPAWSSSGTGVFTSTSNLTTTYTPSASDISAGFATFTLTTQNNGLCPGSSSTVQVNITPSPTVSAGPSQTICSNNTASLNGNVIGPTGTGIWSSSGTGSFNPSPNILNPIYVPSAADINSGTVTLTLTSTGNGNCLSVSSTKTITIVKIATVSVIPSQTICSNTPSVALSSTIAGGTNTGSWTTTGSGTFNPGNAFLNNTYLLSTGDQTATQIGFTLTSTNNGPCPAITNTLSLTIIKLATVSVISSQTLCSNAGSIALTGTVSGGTNTGNWTSNGSGSFNPGPTWLNNTYSFTQADITAGLVNFSLTSTNNGPCPAVTNTIALTIIKLATVSVIPSQTLCSNAGSIALSGTISGGTNTGNWTSNGSGAFSPGPASLNNTYSFTPADITAGLVNFSLTSTNNGPCPAITNTLSLSIIKLATVSVSPSQTVCSNSGSIALTGTVSGGTNTGNWTSNGSGAFNSGPTALINTYLFTPADITAGTIDFTLASTNNGPCPAVTSTLSLTIIKLATVSISPSQTVCSNSVSIALTGTVSGGTNTGNWTTNGSGSFNPGPTWLNNSYSYTPADITAGLVNFSLTSTNNGPCPAVTNTLSLTIIKLATVSIIPSQTLCSNAGGISLSGTVSGGTNTGNWTTNGSGIFNPGPTALINTYSFTPADIIAGTIDFTLASTNNGPCPAVTSTLSLSIIKLATVSISPSQTVCSNSGSIALTGTVSGGTNTGNWTTNGSGSFNPGPTWLNNTYSFTPADITAGLVNFSLTSTNNGPCPAVTNTLSLTIIKLATVSVIPSQTVCSNSGSIALTGTLSGGTNTGNWTTNGSGSFNPGPLSLNNTYSFTPADIMAGLVDFTLTSTNNGPCPAVASTLSLTIIKLATVSISPSQTVCSNSGSIALTGTMSGGTNTGNWTTNGSGSFNPGPLSLNNTYSFTPADITAGLVNFSLTSTNNGPCPAVTNTLSLTIIKLATVSISPSQTVCSNSGSIALSGTVNGGTSTGNWTTNGSGSFNPGPTSLNNNYSFTPADIAAGTINFTLTSTNNGPCPAVTNTVSLTTIQLATVNAGPNQALCSTSGTIGLNGAMNPNNGIWTCNGTGTFIPNNQALNATYSLSPADILAGSVTFTLSSLNNGSCPMVKDTVQISIFKIATLTVSPSQTLCSNAGSVALTGTVNGSTNSGNWTSNGSGSFNPGPTSLNNSYFFTPADITSGLVNFSLTSTNNGPCPAVTNTLSLTIIKVATVSVIPSQTLCSNAGSIALTGTISGGTNTGNWTSNGSGSFNPGPASLNNSYSFTPADISAGLVNFSLSSTNNGPCPAITNTLVLTIIKLATVSISPSQTLCSNAGGVVLTGTMGGGTNTGSWTTNGSGSFNPGPTSLNNTYSYTPADITAGLVNFSLTSTNNGPCPAVTNTLSLTIIKLATVSVIPSQTVCSNSGSIALSGTLSGGTNSGNWTSNGSGSFNPGPLSLNNTYSFSIADITAGLVDFTLTSTNNGPCPAVTNTLSLTIIKLAAVSVNPSQTVCSNSGSIALSGTVSGGTNTGNWATNGSGAFSPGPASLSNTYSFTPADITAGLINFSLSSTNNGPCPSVTNTLSLTIIKLATISVIPSQTVCSNSGSIALSGTVSGGTNTGNWTSNGSGAFNPGPLSLNNTYSFSIADITAGLVDFTLTSTNNGPCPAGTNTLSLTIIKLATVSISPSQTLCSNSGSIALSGTVSGGTNTGSWITNGSGSFNPGPASLNNTYSFTPADITAGLVNFSLTSTNNGPCPAVTMTTLLYITPLATVNAGPNQFLCSNTGTIGLSGVSNNSCLWTSNGSGTFSPNNNNMSPYYSITAGDIASGSIIFTLSSTNNGVCPQVQDTVIITLKKLAIVNAGNSLAICSTQNTINLNGSVTAGNPTGLWSTNGSGTFSPSATALNNNYSISNADIGTGNLIFTLSSTNNGPCPVVSDTLMLTIYKLATVNAGPNQFLCSTAKTISLNGNINPGTGLWSSGGSGIFYPNNASPNSTYSLSVADLIAGSVTFTFSSTNNGVCPTVKDSVKISLEKLVAATAGADQNICSTNTIVSIHGIVMGGTSSGTWLSMGSGNFSPSNNSLLTGYVPSVQDINSGSVILILKSTSNGVCPGVTDTVNIKFFQNPRIQLIKDTAVCDYQNPIKIDANVSGNYGILKWSTNGTGTFSPTVLSNPVTYDFKNDILPGAVRIVSLTVTASGNGPCGDVNASTRLIIHPSPEADFTASSYTVNIPNDRVTFNNQSINAGSSFWDFGDGGSSSIHNPAHNYVNVGYYNVSLIVSSSYGCTDTAKKEILVVSDIQFPNAFTPNPNGSNGGTYDVNDYSNDVFFPYTAGVTEYKLQIFNRWGELIFESNNVMIGWDGYFRNKLCQQDAYVWKADVKFFNGRNYNKVGSVTLIR